MSSISSRIVGVFVLLFLVVAGGAPAQVTVGGHTVWRLENSPVVVGAVQVVDGGKLTIEAGVEVLVEDASLWVEAGGILETLGTAAQPVRFGLAPSGTFWTGLQGLPGSSLRLTHTFFADGGMESVSPLLDLQTGDAVLRDVTITSSPAEGCRIYGDDLTPSLIRVTCQDNAGDGLVIFGDRCSPIVEDLAVLGNGGWGIVTALSSTPDWRGGRTMEGNAFAGTRLWPSSRLVGNRTLDLSGAPYIVGDWGYVGSNGTLTVLPGVEVLFPDSQAAASGLTIEQGGRLVAAGTPSSRIRFGSESRTDVASNWQTLQIRPGAEALIEYVDVEDGGSFCASILVESADTTIRHTAFRRSANWGLWFQLAELGRPVIEDCSFEQMEQSAICHANPFASPVYRRLTSTGSLRNWIEWDWHMWIPYPIDVPVILADAGLPHRLSVEVEVEDTLTIEPGAIVLMNDCTVTSGGRLLALGTAAQPIQFLPYESETLGVDVGDGVILYEGGSANLSYCTFRGFVHQVRVQSADFAVANCSFQGWTRAAIWALYGAQPRLGHNEFLGTSEDDGIIVDQSVGWPISTVDARLCWWGHPSGPYHPTLNPGGLGAAVSDDVRFLPWAMSPQESGNRVPDVLALGEVRDVSLEPGKLKDFVMDLTSGAPPNLAAHLVVLDDGGDWQVSIRRGVPPSGIENDATAAIPGTANAAGQALLPSPRPGLYFVTVSHKDHGQGSPRTGRFSQLQVSGVERGLTRVATAAAGNGGITTQVVSGAGFQSGCQLELSTTAMGTLATFAPSALTSTSLIVPMDLTALPVGQTDITIAWPDAGRLTLPGAFEILPAEAGELRVDIAVPDFFRNMRPTTGLVWYRNVGGADIDCPILEVSAPPGVGLRVSVGNDFDEVPIRLLGVNQQTGLPTLPPGASFAIPFQYQVDEAVTLWATLTVETVVLDEKPIDWEAIRDVLRPEELDQVAWVTAWPAIRSRLGENWQELATALRAASQRRFPLGQHTWYVHELLTDLLRFGTIGDGGVLAGQVRLADNDVPLGGLSVIATELDGASPTRYATTDSQGRFFVEGLTDGVYALTVDRHENASACEFTIADQEAVSDIELLVVESADSDSIEGDGPQQSLPMLAAAAAEEFLVGWTSEGQGMVAVLDESNVFGVLVTQPLAHGPHSTLLWSDHLLGVGQQGAFVLWNDMEPDTGQSRLQWSVGRPTPNGMEWSAPLDPDRAVNGVADWSPTATLLPDGDVLVAWMQYDPVVGDDADLYWTRIDPMSHGDWMPPHQPGGDRLDTTLRTAACDEFRFGHKTSYPAVLTGLFGKEFKLALVGTACDSEPSCTEYKASISASAAVSVATGQEISGGVSGERKYQLRKGPPCIYLLDSQKLAGTVAGKMTLKVPVRMAFAIGPIPVPVMVYPSVSLQNSMAIDLTMRGASLSDFVGRFVLTTSGSGGFMAYAWGEEATGGAVQGGGELIITGNLILSYSSAGLEVNSDGFCAFLDGKIGGFYGYFTRRYRHKIGGACPGRDDFGTPVFINGIPMRSEVEDISDPFTGTATIHAGNSVLPPSELGTDLYHDGPPRLGPSGAGSPMVAWRKDAGPLAPGVGAHIVVSTFDGTQWSGIEELTTDIGLNDTPAVVVLPNGDALAAWAGASSAGLASNSTIEEFRASQGGATIEYALRTAGVWGTPRTLARLPGQSMAPALAVNEEGTVVATWLEAPPGDGVAEIVRVSSWSGAHWTTPRELGRDAIAPPQVVASGSRFALAYTSEIAEDPFESDPRVRLLTSPDGVSWATVPLPRDTTALSQPTKTLVPRGFLNPPKPKEECCKKCEGQRCCDRPPCDTRQPPGDTSQPGGTDTTTAVEPRDPNEKDGPTAWGIRQIWPHGRELTYAIWFENVADATAPAQDVSILDTLDPSLDWESLRLTSIGWGSTTLPIGDAAMPYHDQIAIADYRSEVGQTWLVDATANIDPVTGRLSIMLRTLDPITRSWPEDALAGFLPPNDSTGRGQGYVTFRVQHKEVLPDDLSVVLQNEATIIFDTEDPIITNTLQHTLGNYAELDQSLLNAMLEKGGQPPVDINGDGVIDASDYFGKPLSHVDD